MAITHILLSLLLTCYPIFVINSKLFSSIFAFPNITHSIIFYFSFSLSSQIVRSGNSSDKILSVSLIQQTQESEVVNLKRDDRSY